MDTFIDKLAQKRNAQEMIRANMTAEAVQMEQMQNQMKAYDELMQEIRQVNLKTAQNASEVQDALKECMDKLQEMQEAGGTEAADEAALVRMKELLEEKFGQSDDFLHKENVKVYRNVQAAVIEELNKQTAVLNDQSQELNRQMEELKQIQLKNKKSKAVVPLLILILLGVIANAALMVYSYTFIM